MKLFKRKKESEKKARYQKFVLPDSQEIILNTNNLAPVIIQELDSLAVLHLGYMDRWALTTSLERGVVYLYRRSKGRLELFGGREDLEYRISDVKMDRSHRALLLLVTPESNVPVHPEKNNSFANTIKLEKVSVDPTT